MVKGKKLKSIISIGLIALLSLLVFVQAIPIYAENEHSTEKIYAAQSNEVLSQNVENSAKGSDSWSILNIWPLNLLKKISNNDGLGLFGSLLKYYNKKTWTGGNLSLFDISRSYNLQVGNGWINNYFRINLISGYYYRSTDYNFGGSSYSTSKTVRLGLFSFWDRLYSNVLNNNY